MLLNVFRSRFKKPEEEVKTAEKKAEKSSSAEKFLKTTKAKTFVKKWSSKKKGGEKLFTKRGVTALLGALFQNPGLETDGEVVDMADDLLEKLGGMDGLQGFLLGWKAKSEGLMGAIKKVVGSEE